MTKLSGAEVPSWVSKEEVLNQLHTAATAPAKRDADEALQAIWRTSPKTYDYLGKMPLDRWCAAYCTFNPLENMTSNDAGQ